MIIFTKKKNNLYLLKEKKEKNDAYSFTPWQISDLLLYLLLHHVDDKKNNVVEEI